MRGRHSYGYHFGVDGLIVYDYDEGPYDSSDHGPGCQCDDCMWVEEKHFRTYTPSVPKDAPMEDE